MAPSKKRERDSTSSAANVAGNAAANNGSNNSALANSSVGAATTAAATTVGNSVEKSDQKTAAENTKLNGHQQEQELFLQAFESKLVLLRNLGLIMKVTLIILQSPHKSIVFCANDMAQV